jgi:hypothetical protein
VVCSTTEPALPATTFCAPGHTGISRLGETVRQSEAKITENTEGLIKKQNQETEAKLQALDETLKSKEAVFQALIESLKGKNIKPP